LLTSACRNKDPSIVRQIINGDQELTIFLSLALRNLWSSDAEICYTDTWVADNERRLERAATAELLEALGPD
jgi:hypothetical protein